MVKELFKAERIHFQNRPLSKYLSILYLMSVLIVLACSVAGLSTQFSALVRQ